MFIQQLSDLLKKRDARDPFIPGIRIREMLSDIAKRCGAEQGVHDRMDDHIRVRMSQQSLLIRDLHASQDQFPPLGELMYIISDSDSHSVSLPSS